MSTTKKIVMTVICAVIAIVACVVSLVDVPNVGKGSGRSAEISSLRQFGDVLNSAVRYDDGEEESGGAYGSYTFTEVTRSHSSRSYEEYGNGVSSESKSSSRFDRTLTVYKNGKSTHYVSVCRTEGSSSRNDGDFKSSSKTSMDFSIKLQINGDSVYLYIERWEYTYRYKYSDNKNYENDKDETEADTELGKQLTVLRNYRNKWIDCSSDPSVASAFLNVDSGNALKLSSLASLISRAVDSDEAVFDKSNDVYTMKKKAFKEFFGVPDSVDKYSGSFKVDLGNAKQPKLDYDVSVKMDMDETVELLNKQIHIKSKSSAYATDSLTFKDVDNTEAYFTPDKTVDIAEINEQMEEL